MKLRIRKLGKCEWDNLRGDCEYIGESEAKPIKGRPYWFNVDGSLYHTGTLTKVKLDPNSTTKVKTELIYSGGCLYKIKYDVSNR